LAKFSLPATLESAEIDYAELVLSVEIQQGSDAPCGIVAMRLARSWNDGAVGWHSPWINPGGDFTGVSSAAEIVNARDANKGVARVAVDVTDIVQHWVLHPGDNYGLGVTSTDPGVRLNAKQDDELTNTMLLRVYFTSAQGK